MYGDRGLAGDVSFYKAADHRPSVVFRPWEPPAERPDDEYPFVFCTGRLLEHWHTGSMTRRVPELNNALPEALLDMNPADMEALGIKDGEMVKVVSRWGEVQIKASSAGRTQPPEKYLFAPFFAEETLVNLVQQEMYCPLSKEPDYKKTCVRVEKL
jgi:nitrate reductase NapA